MLQNTSRPCLPSKDSRVQRLIQHMSPFKAEANTYPNGSHCCPDNRLGSQMTCGPSANHVLLSSSLQGGFPAYKKKKKEKKGVSAVHVGGSKCVNANTHGCGDLVWQEYMSFLSGHCDYNVNKARVQEGGEYVRLSLQQHLKCYSSKEKVPSCCPSLSRI